MGGKSKTGLGGVGVFWIPRKRRGHHGGHHDGHHDGHGRHVQPAPNNRRHLLHPQPPFKPNLNFHEPGEPDERKGPPAIEYKPLSEGGNVKPPNELQPETNVDQLAPETDNAPSCSKSEETVDSAITLRKHVHRPCPRAPVKEENSCCTECMFFCVDSCAIL